MARTVATLAAVLGLLSAAGCSTSEPVASEPTHSPSVPVISAPVESPSPVSASGQKVPPLPSPTPLPIGTPVARQVLAPASVLPVGGLCSTPIIDTADGNATPLQCRSGAVNVLAWRFYMHIGVHVMSLGRAATLTQVRAALCADPGLHATLPEQYWAYRISAAYYGWAFASDPNLDPSCS